MSADAFRELHRRDGIFVMPNPWDAGTARLLARLGFEALATTSAGYAFSRGRRDNRISRDEMLAHVAEIVRATELPVSADLENGHGGTPDAVAETFRLAAAAGAAGGSIEDASGDRERPILDIEEAADRVRAAAGASFTLTARAENYLCGRPNLADTIRRLQAYGEAGADVLYAPGVTRRDEIAAIVKSVGRPVNVLMTPGGLTVGELQELGVKRVSVGSAFSRVALGAFWRAARDLRNTGSFDSAEAVGYHDLNATFED